MTQLYSFIRSALDKQVPATGLGLFRMAFSAIIIHEVGFLYYFRQLIFDPVPYLDVASPAVHFFLMFWLVSACALFLGYATRVAACFNYLFWLVFTVFTPMWKDFDGGFDQLMLGASLLLIFLPAERAWSLDRLRYSLRASRPGHTPLELPRSVSVLAYLLPVLLSLGLVYIDSVIHKLFAEHWRQGLGPWLPASLPYYRSELNLDAWLNSEWLQRLSGYSVLVFQLLFLAVFFRRRFRVPVLLMGSALHTGIILALNVYPFGFAMLVHYLLLVPFRWWRAIGRICRHPQPVLRVFYDGQCPLCLRAVLTMRHFDVCGGVEFLSLQHHARHQPELAAIPESRLLADLHAVDARGRCHSGVACYARILIAMRYTAPLGVLLCLPLLHGIAVRVYRHIADNRERETCKSGQCASVSEVPADPGAFLLPLAGQTPKRTASRISRILVLLGVLQLNCIVHYGLFYRLGALQAPVSESGAALMALSNGLISLSHAFLGITPHPLYVHDHFQGYEHIVGITWEAGNGQEIWLPLVAEDGHMPSPNWGRIHSMWANVAITRHMEARRLDKFVRKVTAYYGREVGADTGKARFRLYIKRIEAPMFWVRDLRRKNAEAPWEMLGYADWSGGIMTLTLQQDVAAVSRDAW